MVCTFWQKGEILGKNSPRLKTSESQLIFQNFGKIVTESKSTFWRIFRQKSEIGDWQIFRSKFRKKSEICNCCTRSGPKFKVKILR